MHDCLIIGGGVIGLSVAWELSRHGLSCAVLDQQAFGQESSWAGAGMLPPGNPAKAETCEERLRSHSHVLWPEWTAALREASGIDNGFRRDSAIEVRFGGEPGELDDEIRRWHSTGVACQPLTAAEARGLEPALGPGITSAYLLPEHGQVRNPRHVKALQAACAGAGVTLLPGTPVWEIVRQGGRVTRVETPAGRFSAGQYVVASGAWSERLLAPLGNAPWVRPLRGQMVLLSQLPCPLGRVINLGHRYLVPRGDGRVLVGSTEEDVGFDRRNTAEGVYGLLELARQVVPALAQGTLERTWAGLRPRSIDGQPYLGRWPGLENLIVATGHHRAGLQLSPITAVLVGELVRGQEPRVDLHGFRPDRVGSD
ncbi:MAG: glycine oxidase ThiO [Planctomycetaceae bacterium]